MSHATVTLSARQVERLHLRQGDVVVVRQGRLWLTCQGDARDHILQAGTCFVATRSANVVIEAVGAQACRYEVERPQPVLNAGKGCIDALRRRCFQARAPA